MADAPDAVRRPLPWHAHVWTRLCLAAQSGLSHHALLIEGLPGTGRRRFAEAVAALLLCSDSRDDGNCGSCRACSLREAGNHGDLCLIEPEEEGKAIGVDAIRAAITFANGTPTLGKSKVLLVSAAHRLTSQAFNAFLKSLEEPPPGTFMLLVAARGHPLPATIRSRCQRLALPAPDHDEALAWLRQALANDGGAVPEEEEQLSALLRLMPRRPLDALRLHREGDADAARSLDAALSARDRDALERAAKAVPPDRLIDIVENALQTRLRGLPVPQLRARTGVRTLDGLARIETLRAARRLGQNPNVDLVRRQVVEAFLQGQPG